MPSRRFAVVGSGCHRRPSACLSDCLAYRQYHAVAYHAVASSCQLAPPRSNKAIGSLTVDLPSCNCRDPIPPQLAMCRLPPSPAASDAQVRGSVQPCQLDTSTIICPLHSTLVASTCPRVPYHPPGCLVVVYVQKITLSTYPSSLPPGRGWELPTVGNAIPCLFWPLTAGE